MENQELTVNEIDCIANCNINGISIEYTINGILKRQVVTGNTNMITSKSISVYREEHLLDSNGDIFELNRLPQYNVSNSQVYDAIYNGLTIPGFNRGNDQYLMALNGLVNRCVDLGGDPLGQNGHQPWDETDGTLKPEYVTP
jgi:hypothetical protein